MTKLSDVILRDTYANRPAAGTAGRLYYATDYGIHYRDNGATWDALLDINALTADATPDAAADYVVTYDASAGYFKKVLLNKLPSGSSGTTAKAAVLQDQRASNTDGGTFTAGSWVTRTLNTESDPDGIVTLSSNQFTLGAGEYLIQAWGGAHRVARNRVRIYNVTAGSVAALGYVAYADATYNGNTLSHVSARVSLAGSTVFELQGRCQTTGTTTGLGFAWGIANEVEVYAEVTITKLS